MTNTQLHTNQIAVWVLRMMQEKPGIKAVCVCPIAGSADMARTAIREMMECDEVEAEGEVCRTLWQIKMRNGSCVHFKVCDDPHKVRGWACHILWFEAGVKWDVQQACLFRLRPDHPRMPATIFYNQR